MNLKIKSTNLEITEEIKKYLDKVCDSVAKFFKNDTSVKCDVEFAKTTAHHKHGDIFRAEIHITGKNTNHYASAEEDDIYKAIDAVKDEILREVRSNKAKKLSVLRKSGSKIKKIIKGIK